MSLLEIGDDVAVEDVICGRLKFGWSELPLALLSRSSILVILDALLHVVSYYNIFDSDIIMSFTFTLLLIVHSN